MSATGDGAPSNPDASASPAGAGGLTADVVAVAPSREPVDRIFVYESPGLRIEADMRPDRYGRAALHLLTLDYDPSRVSRFSVVRRVLGNRPERLTQTDLRLADTASLPRLGRALELYLPSRTGDGRDHGPLVGISLESGQLCFYPEGTDVAVPRSIGSFLNGFLCEALSTLQDVRGNWRRAPAEAQQPPAPAEEQPAPDK